MLAAGRGHGADLLGLVLIVLAFVTALGVYADAAGPAGRGSASGAGLLLGAARVLAPPVLLGLGVLLMRRTPTA